MHLKHFGFLFLAAGLVVIALAGCSPAAQPTLMATVAIKTAAPVDTAAPVVETLPPGYQAPGQEEAAPSTEATAYPVDTGSATAPQATTEAYPGPNGVQAVDNRAKVTGTLIEKAADPANTAYTRLHVNVQAVEDVEGMPNFAKDLANKEADLYVETAKLPDLNPNDRFEAQVTYTGDEGGGKYNVLEIKKIE